MTCWRINTDRDARNDVKTCDIWYNEGMAFAGDYKHKKWKHSGVFRKLKEGDIIFMHHNGSGIVGRGKVIDKEWNGKSYEGKDQLLYLSDGYEYRIRVDWDRRYDRRKNPLPVFGLIPGYHQYYCEVKPELFKVVTKKLEL